MFILRYSAYILISALLLFAGGDTALAKAIEHAEPNEQNTHPMIVKMPKDLSTLSEGETITPESMLEIEPVDLRAHGEQLVMKLPPLGEPFAAYELATGITTFINAHFLNAGAPLPMSALVLRIPAGADTQTPAEQDLKNTIDDFIGSYQENSRVTNLKILSNESTVQDAHPARHLTMRADLEGADTILDVLVLASETGTWLIHLNYDPNDKNIVNHAHFLFSSISLNEDSEKTSP